MNIQISEKLNAAYINAHKTHNYALNFLLSSMDLDHCAESMRLVEDFKLSGDKIAIKIDDENIDIVKKVFGHADSSLVEQLLWVSILFPEI